MTCNCLNCITITRASEALVQKHALSTGNVSLVVCLYIDMFSYYTVPPPTRSPSTPTCTPFTRSPSPHWLTPSATPSLTPHPQPLLHYSHPPSLMYLTLLRTSSSNPLTAPHSSRPHTLTPSHPLTSRTLPREVITICSASSVRVTPWVGSVRVSGRMIGKTLPSELSCDCHILHRRPPTPVVEYGRETKIGGGSKWTWKNWTQVEPLLKNS